MFVISAFTVIARVRCPLRGAGNDVIASQKSKYYAKKVFASVVN